MLDFSNKIEQENQQKDSRISHLISLEKVDKKQNTTKKKKKAEPIRVAEKRRTRNKSQNQEKSPPKVFL